MKVEVASLPIDAQPSTLLHKQIVRFLSIPIYKMPDTLQF